MATAAALTACAEVLEALLLFMGLQHGHFSQASLKHVKPELSLSLAAEEKQCKVQVSAGGLGAYYLDGKSFLQQLCEHGQQLKRALPSITSLRLLCRRIGDYEHIMSYEILEAYRLDGGQIEIRESMVPRPQDFPPAGLVITIMVPMSHEVLYSEVDRLAAQVHLLHLINPTVYFSLNMKDHKGAVCSLQYDKEPHKPIPNSPFKMVTALCHYMDPDSIPVRQSRLYLLRSSTYTIPQFTVRAGESFPLKIYCSVAVVPHLPLRNGRKIPADRLCRSLHISVFGPGNLPVIPSGSQANFPLANIANWENYGLSIGQPIPAKYNHIGQSTDQCPVVQSLTYEVRSKRGAPRLERKHFLQLFIFLEEGGDSSGSCGDNDQWRQLFGLVHELRGRFDSLVMSHSKKFQQTIHSALNKLICNYGSYTKTSSVLGSAIPLISEAVASILQHSTNDEFKRKCRRLVQVDSNEDVERAVSQRLWQISREKLQISHPLETIVHVPDEPTSPEIIQAASEADQAKTKSKKKRTSIATTDDKTDGDVQRPSQDAQREVTEAPQEDTHISDADSSTLSGDHFNSQSLFQARMISLRKKREHCSQVSSSHTTEVMHESGQHPTSPTLTCMHSEDRETSTNSTAIVSDDSFEALTSIDECMGGTQHSTTKTLSDSQIEEYSEPLLVTGRLPLSNPHPPSTPIQADSLISEAVPAIGQSASGIPLEMQCSAGFDDESFEALTSIDECMEDKDDTEMEGCSKPLLDAGRPLLSNVKPQSMPIQEDPPISQSATGVPSETPCSAGFDDLEMAEVKDELNGVLSPCLGCSETARDGNHNAVEDGYTEFDELEHVSVCNSITDDSFTDNDMDLSGFSVDSDAKDKNISSDKALVVNPVVESIEVPTISGGYDVESCPSDSEWDDVALGPVESTPVCPVGPLTPDSFDCLEDVAESFTESHQHIPSTVGVCITSDSIHDSLADLSDVGWEELEDTHSIALLPQKMCGTKAASVQEESSWPVYGSDSFDCLEDVAESFTECQETQGVECIPSTVGVCTMNDSLADVSDLEWEEDTALLPPKVCGTNKTTSVQEHTFHGLELQAPHVPDIMNQSLTCGITEDDFHWD